MEKLPGRRCGSLINFQNCGGGVEITIIITLCEHFCDCLHAVRTQAAISRPVFFFLFPFLLLPYFPVSFSPFHYTHSLPRMCFKKDSLERESAWFRIWLLEWFETNSNVVSLERNSSLVGKRLRADHSNCCSLGTICKATLERSYYSCVRYTPSASQLWITECQCHRGHVSDDNSKKISRVNSFHKIRAKHRGRLLNEYFERAWFHRHALCVGTFGIYVLKLFFSKLNAYFRA